MIEERGACTTHVAEEKYGFYFERLIGGLGIFGRMILNCILQSNGVVM
jgi:hypothetical protein